MKTSASSIIAILILSRCTSASGAISVPGLTPSHYVIPGDLNIGVLHRIFLQTPESEYCNVTTGALNPLLLQLCEGAVFAAKQINARRDILPNITIGLTCVDSCGDPQVALARSLNLVGSTDGDEEAVDKVVGVIGPGFSRVAVTVSPFFGMFKIPVLSTYASADELSSKEKFAYFMRMAPPDRFQAQVMIDIVLSFNWTYIGLFYSEGNYGETGAKFIEELVRKNGICLAYSHKISQDQRDDEIEDMEAILDEYPEVSVSIWFMEGPVIQRVISGMKDKTIDLKQIMLLSDSAKTNMDNWPEFSQGGMSVGFLQYEVPGFRKYFSSLVPGVNTNNPWLERTWKVYCPNYNCTNDQVLASTFKALKYAMPYYEATYVFADAIHTVIARNCPEAFENLDFLDDCIDGEDLLRAMKESELNMTSGPILFDNNGDRIGRYHLYHYIPLGNGEVGQELVAVWEKGKPLEINIENINWSYLQLKGVRGRFHSTEDTDTSFFVPSSLCSTECQWNEYMIQKSPHCCWECRSCHSSERLAHNKTTCAACDQYSWPDQETLETCVEIPLDYLRLSDKLALCLIISSLFGVILSSCSSVVLILNRNSRLVKASNKKLTFTMLVGSFLAFIMSVPFVAKPSGITCFLRDVGFNAVFTLLYAPLFVKTCTIYCIFKAGKKGKRTPSVVSNRGQTTILVIAFSIQLCILLAVKSVWPSKTKLHMPALTEPYVELMCAHDVMIPFLLPLTYNILLIFMCGFLGYGCRKLPENFNESGFIFVSASTTIFTWVVFLPTFFTTSSSKHQVVLLNLCLLLNAFITVGCLFAPKVYALYCVEEDSIQFASRTSSTPHGKVTSIQVKPNHCQTRA